MPSIDRHPQSSNKLANGLALAAGVALGLPLAVAGGWIGYSTFVIDHHLLLPPAMESDTQTLSSARWAR